MREIYSLSMSRMWAIILSSQVVMEDLLSGPM